MTGLVSLVESVPFALFRAMSHTLAVVSDPPLTRSLLSGENATLQIGALFCLSAATRASVFVCQSRISPSELPLAIQAPSREKATARTPARWPSEDAEPHAALGVPEPDGPVPACRGDRLVVGRDRYLLDGTLVTFEDEHLLFLVRVPHSRRLVLTAGDEGLAAIEEGDSEDMPGVSPIRLLLFLRAHVPKLHDLIQPAADEPLSVARKGDAVDADGVSLQRARQRARFGIAKRDVAAELAASDDLAVGGEHRAPRPPDSADSLRQRQRFRVPELDLPRSVVPAARRHQTVSLRRECDRPHLLIDHVEKRLRRPREDHRSPGFLRLRSDGSGAHDLRRGTDASERDRHG